MTPLNIGHGYRFLFFSLLDFFFYWELVKIKISIINIVSTLVKIIKISKITWACFCCPIHFAGPGLAFVYQCYKRLLAKSWGCGSKFRPAWPIWSFRHFLARNSFLWRLEPSNCRKQDIVKIKKIKIELFSCLIKSWWFEKTNG